MVRDTRPLTRPNDAPADPVEAALGAADAARSRARGQGLSISPEARRAIERHAMARAAEHFVGRGYTVDDSVHKTCPYNLHCTRGQDVLYVEGKGSQSDGAEVLLTPNEVAFARQHWPDTAIAVLHSVKVVLEGRSFAPSAASVHRSAVEPADEDLSPLGFGCRRRS